MAVKIPRAKNLVGEFFEKCSDEFIWVIQWYIMSAYPRWIRAWWFATKLVKNTLSRITGDHLYMSNVESIKNKTKNYEGLSHLNSDTPGICLAHWCTTFIARGLIY